MPPKKKRAPPKDLWKISVMERTAELMEKKKSQAIYITSLKIS
jgi:hypothetical protein